MLVVFTWKKIGILGGMGPEATAQLYFKIIRILQSKYGAKKDKDFPEIVIVNLPLPDVVEELQDGVKEQLICGVKKLEAAGVDFIVVPCNTVCYFIESLRRAVPIPIISLPEEVAIVVNKLKLKKVGLLGTKMTIDTRLFSNSMPEVEIAYPTKSETKIITKIILEVLGGRKTTKSKVKTKMIIQRLKSRGAQAVILGCTELSLLIKKSKYVMDTLEILAEATVKRAEKLNKLKENGGN